MKYTNVILAVFVLFLIGCAPAAPQAAPAAAPKEAIKIGFIGPLSGDVAPLGLDMQAGVAVALEEINAQGGVNGRMLEAIYEDGKCNGKDAVTAATKLIDVDKVQFIIGGDCSSETLAAAPLAEAAHVVLLSPSSSNPDVTKAGDYVFRMTPSDNGQGSAIADTVMKSGHKKTAVIYANTDYSLGLANAFKTTYQPLGGTITVWESYEQDAKDFRTQIAKIVASKPDAIYLVSYPVDGALLVKQIREQKILLQLYGGEVFGSPDVVKTAGADNIEGLVYATPKFDDQATQAAAVLPKVRQKKGADLSYAVYAADAYDAANLIAAALKASSDKEPTGTLVKDYLYTVKDYDGAGGKVTIDANGDPIKDFQIMKVVNGTFVKVG